MRQIEISDATFARLQRHAEPWVDTYDTVINRGFDAYEAQIGQPAAAVAPKPMLATRNAVRTYSPPSLPDLTHTKVLSAKLDGKTLAEGNKWKVLLIEAIRRAKVHAQTVEDLRRLVRVNFVPGRRIGDGFEYFAHLDLSIQGQDANHAGEAICHIAQKVGFPIEVMFTWRDNEKAEHPGETGRLVVGTKVQVEDW